MIKYVSENIFNLNVDAIVIPINCVGVMGKGLALQAKNKYSHMYQEYRTQCAKNLIKPGNVYCYNDNLLKLILFPTKDHWRNPSKLDYIEKGLIDFINKYKTWEINSIAFPKIGCGCGGLNWEKEVKPLIEKYLIDLEINVYICI